VRPLEHAAPALSDGAGLVETAKRAFFRNFFRLMLWFAAFAAWTSVAWTLHILGAHVPWPVHLVAVPVIFFVNRALVRRQIGRASCRERV